MDCKSIVVVACALTGFALLADSTWIGAHCSTNPSAWNVAENWDGGVPTGSAKASIPYMLAENYILHFAPPLDFTGEIAGGRDSTDWDVKWPTYLKLTVLDGATWTVGGNGHLIATEGVAARLATTFSGTVLIPPDMSFVAASTLNANIEYVGKGTLTLTTTNQLSHISGFSGTLIWNGPDGSSLTPVDMAVLQQHGIRLGNGAAIILKDRYLAINGVHEIPDWNAAAAEWSFNGTNTAANPLIYDLDTNPPHANAAGELELVNDAAQIHSVFYKGYKLKMCDSWGISFHWKPGDVLPQKYIDAGKSHEWSGMFGFYFVADPTECGTSLWQPAGRGHGFSVNYWEDKHGWQFNKSGIAVELKSDAIAAIGDGVSFREEADVDVTCQNGTLTIIVTQGDRMFALQRPTFNKPTNMGAVPDGYYIGFAASGDYWENKTAMPLVTHTISNFRGWYRAREAHGWQQVADNVYPFTSANCTARIYTDASTYVENAAALRADGSFQLEPYGSRTRNILRSTYAFNRLNKYLVTFDLVAGEGTAAENTEYTKIGFVKCQDAISSWVFKYDNIVKEDWDGYAYPLMMTKKWYQKAARFWADNTGRSNRQASTPQTMPSMVKETTIHASLVYDGEAGIYYQEHSGKHSLDMGWIPPASVQNCWINEVKNPMRYQISHANSWGQVDTVLRNFSIKQLDTPDTSYVGGEIAVEANAAATLRADASSANSATPAARVRHVSLAAGSELTVATDVAGSRVVVDAIAISGDGARISSTAKTTIGGGLTFTGGIPSAAAVFSGDVTFAGGMATIVVPLAWRGSSSGAIPLFTLASTSSGSLPDDYRIMTDDGRDLTGRSFVIVKDNTVSVQLCKGTAVIIQ